MLGPDLILNSLRNGVPKKTFELPTKLQIRENFKMSKREIFSMNRVVARNLLSRRFLRYEVTKNHYDAAHVRHQILEKGNIFHLRIPPLFRILAKKS